MLKFSALIGAITAFAFVGTATAADMAVKAPPPPAASAFNWAGWYIGGNAGYGWARSQEQEDPPFSNGLYIAIPTQPCALPSPSKDCSHTLNGFIGGGQTGYNWQSGNWVYGLEASFSGAKISGTETINFGAGPNTFATKIESLLLATGRLGYARDRTFLYVKAGYAGSKVGFTATGIPGTDTDSVSSWHSGWTAGTGVEYALTQNWIAGVEYDFSDLGQKTTTGVNSPSGNVSQIQVDVPRLQTVLARLSYKFDPR
jgi:outer membrane immunogenic protein